ncbi:PaaI family thioesterase [Micromonospora sp. NPDC000207]|uniref:PaaI family thioesterase n=1 Tax=Micromonospora sp. NPDC000207 TaxID=3154246 RepID=UPI003328DA55
MSDRSLTAAALRELMPYAATLDLRFDRLDPEEVSASLAWAPALCTAGGVMHGGAVVSLADSVAGVCAYLNLPPGAMTTTIELKTNFFAGVRRGVLRAVARPVHVGRSVIVVQTLLDQQADDGPIRAGTEPTRIGMVTQSQMVLG